MMGRKRIIAVSLTLVFLTVFIPWAGAGRATAPYVEGELLLALHSSGSVSPEPAIYGRKCQLSSLQSGGISIPQAVSLLQAAGAVDLTTVVRLPQSAGESAPSRTATNDVYKVRFNKKTPIFKDRESLLSFCTQLSETPGVAYAEPNYLGSLCTAPNDPYYTVSQQATYAAHGLEVAWSVLTGSPGMIIAVIDSGIDLDHVDLAGNLSENSAEASGSASVDDDGNGYVDDVYGWNFVDNNGDVEDSGDHGTRVAGIIAACGNNSVGMTGVCWQADLLPIKVASATGGITVDRVAAALRYAVNRGAKVINLSLVFSGDSATLKGACISAARTAVIVAAAGNDRQNFVSMYPAGYESVAGVAALDASGELASFSNYNDPGVNEWVDFAAPGVDMFSAIPADMYNREQGRGTSLAAPFVAGMMALFRTLYPEQSPAAIRNHLEQTANARDQIVTHGIISIVAAGSLPMEPDLQIASVEVLEVTSSNFDEALDPGEVAEISIEIENAGADMLAAKVATLSSLGSEITILDATSILPALVHGESSRQFLAPFEVEAVSPTTQVDVSMQLGVAGIQTLSFPLRIEEKGGISESIDSNLTLTSDKTWMISGETIVSDTATLTVQAGTTVRFEEDARLVVSGTLNSVGTVAQPIRWLNRTPPPALLFRRLGELPVSDAPHGAALGDLNGDEFLDIVTANYGSYPSYDENTVSVLMGDGQGGFLPQVLYSVGHGPSRVALGDITGDGFVDIVTVNRYSDDVSVLAGDGSGGFASEIRLSVGDYPASLALGDVTGDGKMDIVTANENSHDVSLLAGDGSGGFAAEVSLAVGDYPTDLALGDVTRDGLPDIVVVNNALEEGSILAADGTGGFESESRFDQGLNAYVVLVEDITRDGINDIVTGTISFTYIYVLPGKESGGVGSKVAYPVSYNPSEMALGEVTGDGFLDLVMTIEGADTISILMGDEAGGFGGEMSFLVGDYPIGLALGDVDVDTRTDIVTANAHGNNVSILTGNGGRGFAPAVYLADDEDHGGTALGDVNKDGWLDVVTRISKYDKVAVLINNSTGSFGAEVRYDVGNYPTGLALGDVSGDGWLDIVTANWSDDNISLLANDGAGGFIPDVTYAVGEAPRSVALGEVTGDGFVDLVVANEYSDDVSVLAGDGVGGFIPDVTYAVGTRPRSVALGDVTGDDEEDIVAVCSLNLAILASDGIGGFASPVFIAIGGSVWNVALGDVSGDGRNDIVTSCVSSHEVSVLLNDGAGGFLREARFSAGNSPGTIELRDVTLDGLIDIITVNGSSDDISVFAGDGTGNFAPGVRYSLSVDPKGLALGDVTGDGVVDIVSSVASVLVGDGAGGFGQAARLVCEPAGTVSFSYSDFVLPGPVALQGGGTMNDCTFTGTGGSGLAVSGTALVEDCTAEYCVCGFVISATAATPSGLVSTTNRAAGMLVSSATDCTARSNLRNGILAGSDLVDCLADLNGGTGLCAFDTIENSISTRSTDNGVQARIVEGIYAGSNSLVGIVATERITGCTAISNGQGVEAPLVEDTFVIDSYGEGLVSVTDAIRLEMQENYSISSDEVRFATSILANNGDQVALETVSGMYIAGNEGGGVDGIPVVDSTIIGNNGSGVINNVSVNSSNVAFNKGYGVVGGTVDGSFLAGNELGDISMATETNAQSSPVTTAPAFLYEVTPDRYTQLGPGIHTFTLKFSKPMNTGVIPTIAHGQSPPYTSKVFQNASWINNQELQAKAYIDFNSGDGEHHLRVMGAMASDGFEIPPDTYHSFQVDIEGGKVVSNGQIVEVYPDSLRLQWDPAEDVDLAGYDIVRSQDSESNYALVESIAPATQYLDVGLVSGVTYYYQIWEWDTQFSRNGLTSPFSGMAMAFTPTPTCTSTPTSTATPTPTPTPTLNPSLIWVDFNYSGTEIGTENAPFNTLGEGVNAVIPGGTIRIKAGVTGEVLDITKEVRLEAPEGEARIGVN